MAHHNSQMEDHNTSLATYQSRPHRASPDFSIGLVLIGKRGDEKKRTLDQSVALNLVDIGS